MMMMGKGEATRADTSSSARRTKQRKRKRETHNRGGVISVGQKITVALQQTEAEQALGPPLGPCLEAGKVGMSSAGGSALQAPGSPSPAGLPPSGTQLRRRRFTVWLTPTPGPGAPPLGPQQHHSSTTTQGTTWEHSPTTAAQPPRALTWEHSPTTAAQPPRARHATRSDSTTLAPPFAQSHEW